MSEVNNKMPEENVEFSVRMREMISGDECFVREMLSDEAVMKFIGPKRALSSLEIDRWILSQYESQKSEPFRRVIAASESNEFIGFCGLKVIEGKLDFGVFIRRCYWGKGCAKEACRIMLEIAHSTYGNAFEIFVESDNENSIRLMKSLNLRELSSASRNGSKGALYGYDQPDI